MSMSNSVNDRQKASFIEGPGDTTFVQSESTGVPLKITEQASSAITFIGENTNKDALTSDATWRIKRISINGNTTTEEYADTGKFNQVWDDRASLFPAVPFSNTKSLLFDGINDFLNGGDIHQYDISNSFSISMWVKPDNISATRILFSKAGSAPNVRGYMLRHNATTGDLFLQMRSTSANRNHTFDISLTASVWQHIVFTYNGGSNISGASVYKNGTKNSSSPSGGLGGTMLEGQDFNIASRNGGFFFSGHMDEITVWNKELSQAEVDELYNSGVPFNPTDHSAVANLQSYYTMGDLDTFPTIADNQGSDDLTMINMTAGDIVEDTP